MRFDNKEINEENPWEDDVLERKKFADILTDRVENGISPYTISVNGGWGTGKTFLLQRWRQQLKRDKYKAIYYNAWEDDFCVNPLVSIIGQIAAEIKGDGLDSLIADVKEIAKPFFVKKILGYVHLTKEELQNTIDNTIDEYSEQIVQIKKLKESLEKLTTAIKSKNKNKPLIFIVDELDRCRPTFAIEVLERIKHLFNIPNIIFVLGMNRIELEKSIEHVYGKISSEEYLRRFYDIDLTLSAPKSSDYCRHLIDTNKNTLNALIHRKGFASYVESIMEFYPYLFDHLNLSLRDTEHCFRVLCFMLSTKNLYNRGEGWPATCLIVLKIKDSELYWRFIQRKASCTEVINYIFDFIPEANNSEMENINNIVIREIYTLADDVEWDDIVKEADGYKDYSTQTPHITLKFDKLAKRALPRIKILGSEYFKDRHGSHVLKRIASILDLVEH